VELVRRAVYRIDRIDRISIDKLLSMLRS